jgi:hypothetical protein
MTIWNCPPHRELERKKIASITQMKEPLDCKTARLYYRKKSRLQRYEDALLLVTKNIEKLEFHIFLYGVISAHRLRLDGNISALIVLLDKFLVDRIITHLAVTRWWYLDSWLNCSYDCSAKRRQT